MLSVLELKFLKILKKALGECNWIPHFLALPLPSSALCSQRLWDHNPADRGLPQPQSWIMKEGYDSCSLTTWKVPETNYPPKYELWKSAPGYWQCPGTPHKTPSIQPRCSQGFVELTPYPSSLRSQLPLPDITVLCSLLFHGKVLDPQQCARPSSSS